MLNIKERLSGKTAATEEKTSAAFSDWTLKLKFDRSFTAKLLLSDQNVKEYYADIATALLSFEKVRARTVWSGVTFSAGRSRIAYITIVGKSLRIYLALDPETVENGRYKAKNAANVKSRATTPTLLYIRSEGAKRHALRLIGTAAENLGLKKRTDEQLPVLAEHFKHDSFDNLVARGLIRVVRKDVKPAPEIGEVKSENHNENRVNAARVNDYDETLKKVNDLLSAENVWANALTAISEGESSVRLSKKYMLRSIDEIWVKAIEDCLNSIDALIRNPRHYIAETEEVLPIELTKKISGRSITHLGRHTDMIRMNDNGEVTPMKMLNVFREDSLMTYENKFLNTLVNRLYMFVSRRYNVAKTKGVDEETETLEFENNFTDGDGKGRIKLVIEYAKRSDGADVKNTVFDTGVWKRVERLNDIVTGYVNSSFCKSMDRNFVRPPIMRTNAIIKNKYFRECLALWEFIESYDDAGYGITVSETLKDVSDEHLKEIYEWSTAQYIAFRRHAEDGYGEEENTSFVRPNYSVVKDFSHGAINEDFAETVTDEIDDDDKIAFALAVALAADETEKETAYVRKTTSFDARIRMADEKNKARFAAVANALLSYDKVRMRISRRFATFNAGRKILTRISVNEKSLKVYLALNPALPDKKFGIEDVSDVRRLADTPSKIRIKSDRGVKYAVELINMIADENGLRPRKTPPAEIKAEDYAAVPFEEMVSKGWIRNTVTTRKPPAGFVFDELPSFGVRRSDLNEVAAATAEKISVAEGETILSGIPATPQSVGTEEVSESALRTAEKIEKIVRPGRDYSEPSKYGVDDSADFIRDEQEHEE